ncbi:MAG: CinA family protein, partial [Clostridia bacterium]
VTYSNQAKMEELGVSAGTLEKFGAVSEETALEMVEGLKRVSGSDVCISVTGIAGPGGGSEEKPVGLVYIGFSYGDKKICKKIQMRNVNRSWNRHYTLLCMLNVIYRNI